MVEIPFSETMHETHGESPPTGGVSLLLPPEQEPHTVARGRILRLAGTGAGAGGRLLSSKDQELLLDAIQDSVSRPGVQPSLALLLVSGTGADPIELLVEVASEGTRELTTDELLSRSERSLSLAQRAGIEAAGKLIDAHRDVITKLG